MNFPQAFTLDDEFKKHNRPLTKQERTNLEALIEKEQCADGALTVALIGSEKILCDGYNTLAICQEKGIAPAEPRYLPFQDRAAVLEWMDLRQRARRNLTPEQMAENKAERLPRVAEAKVDGKSNREIADEEGISESQVRSDLEAATAQGCAVEPKDGKVKGKDGRTRKARPKKGKPKAPRKCDRCTRLGLDRDQCDQCDKLNKEKPKRTPPSLFAGNVGQNYNERFEKAYKAICLVVDDRAVSMGKDKFHKATIDALAKANENYLYWSCQKTERL